MVTDVPTAPEAGVKLSIVGGRLPVNASEINRLFTETYSAGRFWSLLARLLDPNGTALSAELYAARYLNGAPVFLQDRVYGAQFMQDLLEGLDRQDDLVSARLGFQTLFWKESDQRSAQHNPYLWEGILSLLKRYHRADRTVLPNNKSNFNSCANVDTGRIFGNDFIN